jgi:hypothetical protein
LRSSAAVIGFGVGLAALGLVACRDIVGIDPLSVEDAGPNRMDGSAPSDGSIADAGPPDSVCTYSPAFDASQDRMQCVAGCIAGHKPDLADFFVGNGAIKLCICGACEVPCRAFCSPTCDTTDVPACDDCASHALVDDGGKCNSREDLECDDGGCQSLSTCIAECPPG